MATAQTNYYEQSKAKWNCTACTFENHILIPHCEICGNARQNQEESDKSEGIDPVNPNPEIQPAPEQGEPHPHIVGA